MLRQSFDATLLQYGHWLLNGDIVELGTGYDVGFSGTFDDTTDEIISISLIGHDDKLGTAVTANFAVSRAIQKGTFC